MKVKKKKLSLFVEQGPGALKVIFKKVKHRFPLLFVMNQPFHDWLIILGLQPYPLIVIVSLE